MSSIWSLLNVTECVLKAFQLIIKALKQYIPVTITDCKIYCTEDGYKGKQRHYRTGSIKSIWQGKLATFLNIKIIFNNGELDAITGALLGLNV